MSYKKYCFLVFQLFGFFQNFDMVFGTAQKGSEEDSM
jgi:hypothetical protein